MSKFQFWQNNVMMGLVDEDTKRIILENSKCAGFKVTDNGHYFTVETNSNKNKNNKRKVTNSKKQRKPKYSLFDKLFFIPELDKLDRKVKRILK